jgi:hypothetical protein
MQLNPEGPFLNTKVKKPTLNANYVMIDESIEYGCMGKHPSRKF